MAVVDMFRRTYISKTLTGIMILRQCRRAHKSHTMTARVPLCFYFLLVRILAFVLSFCNVAEAKRRAKFSGVASQVARPFVHAKFVAFFSGPNPFNRKYAVADGSQSFNRDLCQHQPTNLLYYA